MPTRRETTIEDLRRAIVCLPRHTRVAMLEGIQANEIIVGAYSSDGGICPMLAAHRAGGRTDFISFARAWDRFALGGERDGWWRRRRRARRATSRELLVLRSHLEASLLEDEGPAPDLAAAIRDHGVLIGRRRAAGAGAAESRRRPRPGDPDRSAQLRQRPGWAWLRVFRRLDDYERALELLEAGVRAGAGPDGRAGESEPARDELLV